MLTKNLKTIGTYRISLLLLISREGSLDILRRFLLCSSRIVASPLCSLVLVDSPGALMSDVENLSKIYVCPHVSPLRFAVSLKRHLAN